MKFLKQLLLALIFASTLAVGFLNQPTEVKASFFDAYMSTKAGNVEICGFRSSYGSITIRYYNGAWGWLGTASDGDGVVCVNRWCPSSAERAYWVVVSAPGYTSQQYLFFRNYRC